MPGREQPPRPVDVDVVVPVLDRRRTISRAITSVFAQTYPHVSLVVVDDGSTDDTLEIVRSFGPAVTLLQQDRLGPAAARNRGALAGQSTYLAFLDSDDEADPEWLEQLLTCEGAGVIGCGGRIAREGREVDRRVPSRLQGGACQPVFLPGLFLVRRDLFTLAGGYDERLRFGENTELGWRIMDRAGDHEGPGVRCINRSLVTIHQQASGRSQLARPEYLRTSAEIILATHEERLAQDPAHLAAYHAIAGVNALRMGDARSAQQQLRAATRLRPWASRYWVRWLQAALTPRATSARSRT